MQRPIRGGFAGLRAGLLFAAAFVALTGLSSAAQAETRSLKLYYTHTGERAEIVFKRNGRYDQAGLRQLNRFLRDWRRNEPTKMDPRLFDLVWEAYRQTGSRNYITVISAYRSPATNEMLRRTRGGQAKKSQHTLGKAMDFYIPGVKLSELRAIGMKLQGGGVGYYPKSGSPFVHLDVGSVRAWPRMSRGELSQLFPDGKTLHLPPDGKPLPGYNRALAEYKARGGEIRTASGGSTGGGRSGGLLAALFGGDEDEGADIPAPKSAPRTIAPAVEVAALPDNAPAISSEPVNPVPELPVVAPVPVARPGSQSGVIQTALVAPQANLPAQEQINAFAAAAAATPIDPVSASASAIPDLASVNVPVPQLLSERAVKPTEAATPDATEMASLGVTSDLAGSDDAFVPLPIRRPGERSGDLRSAETNGEATAPTPEEPQTPPNIALASLEMPPVKRGGRIATAFMPVTTPGKAARPSAADAQKGQVSTRTAPPRLTEEIISSWALDNKREVGDPNQASKNRRFVVNQLNSRPKEVYAVGFVPNGQDQPHDRFTGQAVNFMEVARFGPSS